MSISRTFFILCILPALVIFVGVILYPLFYVLFLSLTDYRVANPLAGRPFVGLEHYVSMFGNERFLWAMGRSLYFTVLSTGLSLVVGFAIALLLRRNDIWFVNGFRAIVLVPMLLTPLVVGATFRYMYDFEIGIINYVLEWIGVGKVAFLGSPAWALHAAIFVDVWQWTPLAVIVVLAGLEALPDDPVEAARIDGASAWALLRHIIIPLLRPVLAVVVLIRLIDSFREFDKLYILTAGGPGTSSETLSIYVWRYAFQYFDTGYGSATGVVMLVIITLLAMGYVRLTRTLER